MSEARIEVINEVYIEKESGWKLCFQYGKWIWDDGSSDYGYRFIWRDPQGKLHPQRGQALIPALSDLFELLSKASKEGWLK